MKLRSGRITKKEEDDVSEQGGVCYTITNIVILFSIVTGAQLLTKAFLSGV